MADDINTVALTGRLTRDAELRYGKSGAAFCNFSLANGYSRKQGDEWKEETSFFDCVLIGRRAEALHKYLVKGKQIGIQGRIQQDRWESDGQKRSKVKVMIDNVVLMGGGADRSSSDPVQAAKNAFDGEEVGQDFEDGVPF